MPHAQSGSVLAGTRVGRYEIESLLGAGGMGEVYAAHDSNLGRKVALKILPPQRTKDPDRVARFVREAHASSALNHPAIVSVHDAGSVGDVHFLAMELIDGQPLSEWMRKNRSLPRAIELMAQVADGLARAHANGIVHRDLKPENIMVSREGYAKIVDFGVAKLTERVDGNRAHTGATTPTSRIGTTAYMSPEQVEGRTLDHRADVFAFGTVLYEVIAGRNPFASPQYADTLHNIVHLDPPLESVPQNLRRVVQRCLQKDPERRYYSLKDAALDLREAVAEPEAPARKRRSYAVAMVAVALVAAIASFIVWQRNTTDQPEMRMTRLTNSGKVNSAAISPDGKYLVYVAREGDMQALHVKQIATGTVTRITDPSPSYYFNVRASPDGDYVYYAWTSRAEPNIAHIFSMPLLGGPARRIAADTEFNYSISPDGTRVAFRRFNAFERHHRLTVARVDGSGEEIVLRRSYPEFIARPEWSPDGKRITFVGGSELKRDEIGFYEVTLENGRVDRIPTPRFPSVGAYTPLPDGSGYLLAAYDREQPPQIWFVPRGSETGAQKITNDISAYESITPTADSKSFAAVRDTTDSNIYTLSVGGRAPAAVTSGIGNVVGAGGVRWVGNNEILYTGLDAKTPTFFVVGNDGGTPRRLIRNVTAWQPSVSRDGRRIAFVSDASGSNQIWVMDASGDNARQLTRGGRVGSPSISPDGRMVVYLTFGESQYAWRIDAGGRGKPQQLTHVPTNGASISPDGKWLLCRLRTTDARAPLWRTSVVALDGKSPVQHFNAPQFGGPPLLQWHPRGDAFLYLDWKDGVANIWMQDLAGGEPRQMTFFETGEIFSFDLSPDGTRFAISRGQPSNDAVLIRDFR